MKTNPYLVIYCSLDASVKRERKFYVQSLVGEEGICKDFSFKIQLSTLERLKDDEISRLMGGSMTVDIGFTDFNILFTDFTDKTV